MGEKPHLPENWLRDFIQSSDKGKWRCNNNHNIKYFTEYEIRSITNNYNSRLGSGAFGEVFRGVLEDGHPVAVKRYIRTDSEEGFAKEVIVHSQINHKNVVKLLGCCVEKNAQMLVFEHITNGSLDDHLHRGDNTLLSLDTRLSIAIECAEALVCMHSMYNPVLHGDIKPSNILLDDNMHAKISDFGISRLLSSTKTGSTINVKGSIGYMDPAFYKDGSLDTKSDVYSFGVVLVELLTKIKPTDKKKKIVERFARFSAKDKAVRQLFDAHITSAHCLRVIEGIGKVAKECLKEKFDERPEMNDVAGWLRELRKTLQRTNEKTKAPRFMKIQGMTIHNINNIMTYTTKELNYITKNFSNLLYEELYGELYLGALADNTRVAVRRTKQITEEFKDAAVSELIIQLKSYHRNILKLLGCCLEMDIPILVYEYAPNGSLQNYLFLDEHDHEHASTDRLRLNTRYQIALGLARAIEYLHQDHQQEWVLHCDINPWRVLLDDHFCPKLSGFELSKIVRKQEQETVTFNYIRGTEGYIAPEWSADGGAVTAKTDVYSYGMTLLKIISCGPSLEELNHSVHLCYLYEVVYVQRRIQDILHEHVVPLEAYIDPKSMATVERMLKTAIWCIQDLAEMRPSMSIVVKMLEGIVQITEPPKPDWPHTV